MRGRVQGWEWRPLGSRSFLLSTIIIIYRDRRAITLIIFNYVYNRGVVERIVAKLKQILKKDFNRRVVEGTAFKGKLQFYKCVGVNIV